MNHTPAGPPPSARIRAALAAALRWFLPRHPQRWLPVLLVGIGVGVVALAVPVVSGAVGAPVSLDSSSSNSADGTTPVVLGVDGRPDTGIATPRHVPATRSTHAAAGRPAGTVAGATGSGTTAATDPPPGQRTLPGSTAPAGTGSARSSSSSPASGSSSSPSPSASPSSSSSASPSPSASASSSSPAPPPATGSTTDAVLALVNDARAVQGCAAVTADAALSAAAVTNSTLMAAQGSPAVVDAAGTSSAVAAGEPDADSVVSAWLADPEDAATLLDCGLTAAGVGEVDAAGGPWWTIFLS